MFCDPRRRDRINSFAVVSYIPEPLASFIDSLRQEIVPECFLHAHVTVLPPRQLIVPADDAWRSICELAPGFPPFDVELTEVRVFDVSGVIYLDIGAGADQLREMHAVFNSGILEAHEVFEYCPHVTLAQDIPPDQLAAALDTTRRRWAEYPHRRSFRVETVTFVQNTEGNNWLDLGQCQLGTGEIKLLEPIAAH